jgi:hypothetical protein
LAQGLSIASVPDQRPIPDSGESAAEDGLGLVGVATVNALFQPSRIRRAAFEYEMWTWSVDGGMPRPPIWACTIISLFRIVRERIAAAELLSLLGMAWSPPPPPVDVYGTDNQGRLADINLTLSLVTNAAGLQELFASPPNPTGRSANCEEILSGRSDSNL